MNTNNELRRELLGFIERPNTHGSLQEVLENFPEKLINEKPSGVPYAFWQLLEHIRITQYDMIDFMTNPNYKEMEWPKDYWPADGEKTTVKMWNESISNFQKDMEKMKKIIEEVLKEYEKKGIIPALAYSVIIRETISKALTLRDEEVKKEIEKIRKLEFEEPLVSKRVNKIDKILSKLGLEVLK